MRSTRSAILVLAVPLCLALLWTPGCGDLRAPAPAGKLVVGVTVEPHAWLVRQVAGDRADVFALVRPGESAELYQPTDSQVSRLAGAAVYFQTGMPLERTPGFASVCKAAGTKRVDLRDGLTLRRMARHVHAGESGATAKPHDDHDAHSHDDHAHDANDQLSGADASDPYRGTDPHIWLSPRLLKLQAVRVAEALAEVDSTHAAEYRGNLASLLARLDEVDRRIRAILQPISGKAFLVFHPAWGYFADDYGLRELAIEIEGKEPSDSELTEIQQQARRERLSVVFVQPQFAGRSAQTVAQAIGGRTQTLDDLPAELDSALLDMARTLAESCR